VLEKQLGAIDIKSTLQVRTDGFTGRFWTKSSRNNHLIDDVNDTITCLNRSHDSERYTASSVTEQSGEGSYTRCGVAYLNISRDDFRDVRIIIATTFLIQVITTTDGPSVFTISHLQ
jgi:hypothetical protein